MMARRILPALIVVAFFAFAASEANAQYMYGHRCGYGPYGHPYGSSLYSLGRIPVPPYFAIHPPVYYSGITSTTYGSTPFANPPKMIDYPVHELPKPGAAEPVRQQPGLETKSVRAAKVVLNPYVDTEPTLAPAPTRSAKVIVNPFVTPAKVVSTK